MLALQTTFAPVLRNDLAVVVTCEENLEVSDVFERKTAHKCPGLSLETTYSRMF